MIEKLFFPLIGELPNLLGWQFRDSPLKVITLLIGVGAFVGGILLMRWHQREMVTAENGQPDERMLKFEKRKFRRRMTGSTLIAIVGALLAALCWTDNPRAFATIVLVILSLLVALLGLAVYDMFNVGIQALADPKEEAREALVKEVLRRRQEAEREKGNADEKESSGGGE